MASLNCPHCHQHLLEPVRHENVELDACVHCGGLWLARNELDKVVRTYDLNYPHEGPIVENLGQQRDKTQKQCPHCQEVLTTHQIKQGRELKIDVCHICHGVWLEKGELDYAKLFYEIPEAVKRIQKETTWKHWLFQFFFSLPVEFNIKARKFPLITVILIVLNGLLMLLVINDPRYMFYSWGLIHLDTFHDFLTLFTYQFLHNGWAHLIGNMYFLYILGDNVENAMGRIMFLIFYLLCGVVAGLTHMLTIGEQLVFVPNGSIFFSDQFIYVPLIGASGAVFGLMAAYLYIFRKAKLTFMFIVFQYKLSVVWYLIAFNLLLLIAGPQGISWSSHIGGFIAGLVLSLFLYQWILRNNPLIRYLNQGLTKNTEKI